MAHGNTLYKRYALDHAYVDEYEDNRPSRHMFWKYSPDCGRSLSLRFLLHGFRLGGSESFVLTELAKEPGYQPRDFTPMLCYSVVTFTTIELGGIVPRTQEAAWWIMAEVVLG